MARTDGGGTPLHHAVFSGNPAAIEALLAAGADITAQDNGGATPLSTAWRGLFAVLPTDRIDGFTARQTLFEAFLAGATNVMAGDAKDITHLHYAAAVGSLEVVEALLTAGADVAARVDNGVTPLHAAAGFNGNSAFVEALLAAGADVGALYGWGETPPHAAAKSNENPAVVELFLAAGADVAARIATFANGHTPLHLAAAFDENPAVVEALIAAGADVGALYQHLGETPLHAAAESNENPAVAEALLAAGADVGARNPLGVTPLHWAAAFNTRAVIEALLAAGADLAARKDDDDRDTPLHVAARLNRNIAVVAALLDAGANLEARNVRGQMPLHRAADRYRGGPAIKALVAAGANVEARDEDGNTSLHVAASYVGERVTDGEHESRRHAGEATEALLDTGANPTAPNAAGETPWDLARDNEALRGSDGYWRLNDARFDDPVQESRRPSTAQPWRRLTSIRQRGRDACDSTRDTRSNFELWTCDRIDIDAYHTGCLRGGVCGPNQDHD